MTLEECITDCEQVMFGAQMMKQTEVYDYNRQLASWLKELKVYRELRYEITEAMHWYDGCEKSQGFREYSTSDFIDDIRKYVEQFEEAKANDNRRSNKAL